MDVASIKLWIYGRDSLRCLGLAHSRWFSVSFPRLYTNSLRSFFLQVLVTVFGTTSFFLFPFWKKEKIPGSEHEETARASDSAVESRGSVWTSRG